MAESVIIPLASGTHKIDIYWQTGAGTLSGDGTRRAMYVTEL